LALPPRCHGQPPQAELDGARGNETRTRPQRKGCKSAPHHGFPIPFPQVQSLSRLLREVDTGTSRIGGSAAPSTRIFKYPGTQHGFNNDTTPRYRWETVERQLLRVRPGRGRRVGVGGSGAGGSAGGASGSGGDARGGSPVAGGTGGVSCVPGMEQTIITDCGYPSASGSPLSSVVFNESEVLRAIQPSGGAPSAAVRVFYNEEHALTLGVRQVVTKSAAGTTTTATRCRPSRAAPAA
jgi:hypothetical protein